MSVGRDFRTTSLPGTQGHHDDHLGRAKLQGVTAFCARSPLLWPTSCEGLCSVWGVVCQLPHQWRKISPENLHSQLLLQIKELVFTEPTPRARSGTSMLTRLGRVARAFLFTVGRPAAAVRLALARRPPPAKVTSSQPMWGASTTSNGRQPHVVPTGKPSG